MRAKVCGPHLNLLSQGGTGGLVGSRLVALVPGLFCVCLWSVWFFFLFWYIMAPLLAFLPP